jgi:Zn-dependent protease/predicted transcriptional regulator
MSGGSIRVARIAGIPVGISPLWLLIVALITWSLGSGYYPVEVHGIAPAVSYGLGLFSALLLFASILAHEFGHAIVARRRGVEIEGIDLWLLGGVAKMSGRPHTAGDELRFALAGPAVSAVVSLLFGVLALALPESAPAAVRAVVAYQAEVNLLILGFNLVPAFPLDGGRVARALMWLHSGDLGKATDTAAGVGRVFGYVLIGGGLVLWVNGAPGGLWFAVIGFFLVGAAKAERVQEQVLETFAGIQARDLMSTPAVALPGALSLEDALPCFARYRYEAFPVIDASGRVVGLLTIQQLERQPRSQWAVTAIEAVADKDGALLVGEREEVSQLLERPAFQRVGRAVVVDADGAPVGVVSLTDIERSLRATRLGGPRERLPRLAPRV